MLAQQQRQRQYLATMANMQREQAIHLAHAQQLQVQQVQQLKQQLQQQHQQYQQQMPLYNPQLTGSIRTKVQMQDKIVNGSSGHTQTINTNQSNNGLTKSQTPRSQSGSLSNSQSSDIESILSDLQLQMTDISKMRMPCIDDIDISDLPDIPDLPENIDELI